jgi:hypothetical protein
VSAESHVMKDSLLTKWENRLPQIWGGDKIEQFRNEIAILEELEKCGCDTTRDGLEVKMQIDQRRALILEIMRL